MKKISRIVAFSLLSFTLIFFAGCLDTKKWEKAEEDSIQDYLRNIGDTVYVLKTSGLYYLNILEGTGRMPVKNDTVAIRYTVRFIDRVFFDSNVTLADPLWFIVGRGSMISGIEEGVTYMKEGGNAKFIIPSKLAYGRYGLAPYINGYTPLLWDIQLVEVRAGSKK